MTLEGGTDVNMFLSSQLPLQQGLLVNVSRWNTDLDKRKADVNLSTLSLDLAAEVEQPDLI